MRRKYLEQTRRSGKPILAMTIGLVVVLLGAGNIAMAAHLSHQGIYLKELEQKTVQLKKTNQVIEREMLEYTSLSDLKEKAEDLGFSPTVVYEHLSTTAKVAYNR